MSVYVPGAAQGVLDNVEVKIIVEPIIKINGISIASEDKIRLTTTFLDESPHQLKLNRYNPKIVITRRPDHGKIKKIIRNSGYTEHSNDKEITSFTYKELKSGVIYFIARKIPDEVDSINDYFEYLLLIKSIQPGQAFVSIEIHKVKSGIFDDDKNELSIVHDSPWSMNYFFIIATLVGMFVLVFVLILFIRFHSMTKNNKQKNVNKDYPPQLPRPPDFIGLNNNRLYSSHDEEDSMPVTASSTPLPVLSSIPHCKVIPVGSLEDSESDEMMDMNNVDCPPGQMSNYPFNDENDGWSSSYDVANDVNYSSIMQSPCQRQQKTNPLLRRNQYWV